LSWLLPLRVTEDLDPVTNCLRWGTLIVVGCVALATLAGCAKPREFAEVEGVVTLKGQPIEAVEVLFLPDPEKGNTGNTSTGLTDKQGRYRLRADRDNKDGTVLGFHRVLLIDSYANRDPAGIANKPWRFPDHYGEASKTPLRDVEIKPGKQQLDFDIKGP
jgi:hypothetical protein